MKRQHRHSWSAGAPDELKVGRHTVRFKRSLGEGGFAFIHLVEDVSTGRVLVLKRSSLQSHEGRVVYEKEASIMRSLAHPNIVQIVTAVELEGSKTGAILMEYCPKGHLLEALNSCGGRRMEEEVVLSVMCDVVSAVKYLHDKGITHRDIKLENILRSSSGPHKLCDFGSCVWGRVPLDTAEQRANEEEVVEKTTTQMYRAPEMVDLYLERELTEKVDVWALGCVLYAVCYLRNPFQDAGNLGILNARIRVPDDSEFSAGLVDLIRRCLTAPSAQRPSSREVEAGIHALGKGNPLPPPRHKTCAEADRGHTAAAANVVGVGAPAASCTAVGNTSGGPSHTNDALARDAEGEDGGGRGISGSGRTGTAAGATGKRYMQQSDSQPNLLPTAAQPQLNPTSVAARRLASRKGSASAGSRSSLVSMTPSEQGPKVVIPPVQDPNGRAANDQQVEHGSLQVGWPRVSAAGTAVTGVGEEAGGDGNSFPDSMSNFAAFDQFPAPDMSLSGRQGSFGGSVNAPVAFGESPLFDVDPFSDETRPGTDGNGRSASALSGGLTALGEQLCGVSFTSSSSPSQQHQHQQYLQQQQSVGIIPAGGSSQQAWVILSAGQATSGARLVNGPVQNGFAATFPHLGRGGTVMANGSCGGSGRNPQQQQPSRLLSPPSQLPQTVAIGGLPNSPQQNSAFSPPPPVEGTSLPPQSPPQLPGQAQVGQQVWFNVQQQQWQLRNPAEIERGYSHASWGGGSSATWSAGMGMDGRVEGGGGVVDSTLVVTSPPLPSSQGRDSSGGSKSTSRQQHRHQDFGNVPPPSQPQFPGAGASW